MRVHNAISMAAYCVFDLGFHENHLWAGLKARRDVLPEAGLTLYLSTMVLGVRRPATTTTLPCSYCLFQLLSMQIRPHLALRPCALCSFV